MGRRSGALRLRRRTKRSWSDWFAPTTRSSGLHFRSRIVLKVAEGLPAKKIAKALGISRPPAMEWRKRYAAEGIEGLYHDRPRGKAFKALPKDQKRQW